MLEAFIFLVLFSILFAIVEIYYWEQEIKKKLKFLSTNRYFVLHGLIPTITVFLFTYDILLAVIAYLVYSVLEDICYFVITKQLGSDTSYKNQDWMKRIAGTDIPKYYIINLAIAFSLSIVWFVF